MNVTSFDNEIRLIGSPKIRRFVIKCLENAPKYFWTVSSSSTGKYHPKDEFVEGGLVIHTKRVVKIASHLCEALSIEFVEKDCIIAASIMHDLCKNGYPEDKGHTVEGHSYLWSELARECVIKNDFLDNDSLKTISRLILFHMGKYDMPYVLDWQDELATVVHIADYLASREDVIVEVDINENK